MPSDTCAAWRDSETCRRLAWSAGYFAANYAGLGRWGEESALVRKNITRAYVEKTLRPIKMNLQLQLIMLDTRYGITNYNEPVLTGIINQSDY